MKLFLAGLLAVTLFIPKPPPVVPKLTLSPTNPHVGQTLTARILVSVPASCRLLVEYLDSKGRAHILQQTGYHSLHGKGSVLMLRVKIRHSYVRAFANGPCNFHYRGKYYQVISSQGFRTTKAHS